MWYPGIFPGRLTFTAEYPERPPTFKFLPIDGKPLFHPNVFNDGKICMSIINPPESTHAYGKGGNWSVSVTIKQASGTGRFATPSADSPCPLGPCGAAGPTGGADVPGRVDQPRFGARRGLQSVQQQPRRVQQASEAAGRESRGGARRLVRSCGEPDSYSISRGMVSRLAHESDRSDCF